MTKIALFWFRRDLRLDDNHALYRALADHTRVVALFIFDRNILDGLADRGDRRLVFIHRRIHELQQRIENCGGTLITRYGRPEAVFEKLASTYDLASVYANRDYEPYARERDAAVARMLAARGVPFHTFKDQCIFEKSEILNGQGKPYTVFTPYKKKWLASLTEFDLSHFDCAAHAGCFFSTHREQAPPSLEAMGFVDDPAPFPAAEIDEAVLARYHQTRDFPALQTTSLLGLHLRFGTLSIRALVRSASAIDQTWLSQFIWRDFFMQILHHFPHVVAAPFHAAYEAVRWRDDDADFQRWCLGRTGFPIVDAGMRQLNQTGYMHNRVRMITASFLCKHLLIDWRKGERYFARKLLDFDLALNNGNWQWAAGTGCDAAPYFRVFNPWTQARKFDPDGGYIRRWIPEIGTPAYPEPMVDHKLARERALEAYKTALRRS